jgi:hypothetical protein
VQRPVDRRFLFDGGKCLVTVYLGLLFALPLAGEDSHLQITGPVESRSYIDMTVHALETFGIVLPVQEMVFSFPEVRLIIPPVSWR